MAFAAPTSTAIISSSNKVAGTSASFTYSAAASVGDLIVVTIAADSISPVANPVTSVTDSKGNTYAFAAWFSPAGAAANGHASVSIYYCKLTTAVAATSDSITVNFSASLTAKAVQGKRFTIDTTKIITVASSTGNSATGASPGSMTLSSLAANSYLAIRGWAIEDAAATSSAIDTSWSSFNGAGTGTATGGGAAASNMGAYGEYRIYGAGTTSVSSASTTVQASDTSSVLLALYEDTPPVAKPRRITVIS